jgi:hypothetical protein
MSGEKDLRGMLKNNPEFRQLKVPYVFRHGTEVYAFDKTKARLEDLELINRDLVVGEQIVTTGLCGDIRIGKVTKIFAPSFNPLVKRETEGAVADDGPCWLFLFRDHDGWRCHTMADKRAMKNWGK